MDTIQPDNPAPARVLYIDVFRGMAIALMIIVNNQGDWGHVFRIFRHAAWHGFLGADIVFPFFLFIMGASIPMSADTHLKKGNSKCSLTIKMIRRALILIALGIFINLLPRFEFSTVRIPGVLQRIGLCYGAAGLIYLFLKPRGRWIAAASIMALYAAALLFIGPAGFGMHPLAPEHNICYLIDITLFAGHTYAHAPVSGFDPEGLLSTFPAIVSTMAGFFAAGYLGRAAEKSPEKRRKTHTVMLSASLASAVSGIAISPVIPINKNLWTPSYVLFTAGIATALFVFLKILDDNGRISGWSLPLRWLGTNPLFIYIASSAVGKILANTSLTLQTGTMTIKGFIFTTLFSSWLPPHSASFAYAFAFLIVWAACAGILYRKGIVIKV